MYRTALNACAAALLAAVAADAAPVAVHQEPFAAAIAEAAIAAATYHQQRRNKGVLHVPALSKDTPQFAGCFGHAENQVMVYYPTADECLAGNRIFNAGLLANDPHFSSCYDHYSGIPYYAHEQDCVKANAVFNERLLTAGGYFSGCQASVLGTHYFPTFRDQATCEVARPILDKFLSTNTTLADLIMSAA